MRRTTGSRYSERRKERNNRIGRKKDNTWKYLGIGVFILLILLFSAAKCCKGNAEEINHNEQAKAILNESADTPVAQNTNSVIDYEVQTETPVTTEERNVSLEIPAKLSCPEIMLYKDAFTVSYNTTTFCPNYVAWHLTPVRVNGEYSRSNNFHPDESLDIQYQVITSDYARSGYDRGHMCPAADNKDTEQHMDDSFLMTNMCPQNHNLNGGVWEELEEQCREWARQYKDIYIVCGPIFDSDTPDVIGKPDRMQIAVPDRFFKVVLIMGKHPMALGFIYPNKAGHKDMRTYCVSVDNVESETGIDFYPSLDDKIENEIEAQCQPNKFGL